MEEHGHALPRDLLNLAHNLDVSDPVGELQSMLFVKRIRSARAHPGLHAVETRVYMLTVLVNGLSRSGVRLGKKIVPSQFLTAAELVLVKS